MANLDKIIEKNVHIDTLVMTDGWKGYLNVENLGFFHEKINHSKHFVDSNDTSIHTQNIENLWCHLKKYIKSRGSNIKKNLTHYINEFKFLKNKKDIFESLLQAFSSL
ncbi:hypothetical protein CDIK_4155 [Cucumispora dikerogammari]|nr:hypothetical protein CDIK_4155 [Cucumispora dikerogammari]